jgi:acetoin utilization protein AcuB
MTAPRVDDYMSRAPFVTYADSTVSQAMAVMETGRVRHLPVLSGPRLVGVLTDRDLRLLTSSGEYDLQQVRVEQVMLPGAYAVQGGTPLAEVVSEMAARRVGSAVVLDGAAVVGMFTTVDALLALAAILRGEAPRARRAS